MIGVQLQSKMAQSRRESLNNNLHLRILQLTELLYRDNNKFINCMPTQQVFRDILEHLYTCYDQLDVIFANEFKEIPLYMQQKIIRQNYHKLFSVNKYLFKNIRNWFHGEYILLSKKNSYQQSYLDGQSNDLGHLCKFCRSSIEQINIKQAKKQIFGDYNMRQQFQNQLSIQKMEEEIQKMVCPKNILEYNNSVNYLTKLISQMESNARSYHIMVQKVEENNPIEQQLGLKKIIDDLSTIINKLGRRCRNKLIEKIKTYQKNEQQIKQNKQKIKRLGISSFEVNQLVKGAKSKKIVDALEASFNKLKQQYKILQSQFSKANSICENYKLEVIRYGERDLHKEREIQILLGTVSALENAKQKLSASRQPVAFDLRSKQKIQSSKFNKVNAQTEALLQLQRREDAQNDHKRKALKATAMSKMKMGRPKMAKLLDSMKTDESELRPSQSEQNNIQVLKQAENEQNEGSQHCFPLLSLIQTKTQLVNPVPSKVIKDVRTSSPHQNIRASSPHQNIRASSPHQNIRASSPHQNITTKTIYAKVDACTQWQELNLPKITTGNKVTQSKGRVKFEQISSKRYAKPIMGKVSKIKGERQLNKTVNMNVNEKSMRFTTMQQPTDQNPKQMVSKSIKSLKTLLKARKAIEGELESFEKIQFIKTETANVNLITIKQIELNVNDEKENRGQFKKIPIHQFKLQIDEQTPRPFISPNHQEPPTTDLHSKPDKDLSFSLCKKPKLIRNYLFKPESLMLFGGVSESFAYQNMKPIQKECILSALEKAYLNQLHLFLMNLKQFKTFAFENVVLFLKKPFELIDRNQKIFQGISDVKVKQLILKFIVFHKQKCRTELCAHLVGFGNIIGFNFIS